MRSLTQIVPYSDSSSPNARGTKTKVARAVPAAAYSVDKFLALDRYITTTSAWRVIGILLVTPLPGLLSALVPAFIPLQDPLAPRGMSSNPGFVVSSFLIMLISGIGTLVPWRASVEFSTQLYSTRQLLVVATVSTVFQYSFAIALMCLWRFPVPMSWIVVASTTSTGILVGHLVVFRARCWRDPELVGGIRKYVPALLIQITQLALYPALSVLFDKVTSVHQVLLTLAFPVIKFVMKKALGKATHDLHDFSTEVAVTGIEVCASSYQSMILQNAQSYAALILIMIIDVLQGLGVVKVFMDRPSPVPHDQILRDAVQQVKAAHAAACTDTQADTGNLPSPLQAAASDRASAKEFSPVVAEALHLVSVAESILLVEYLEVAIPLINAIFIAVACQFSGAQYNTRLRHLYFHPNALVSAIRSVLFYSVLQGITLAAMHLVMRYRYGMSATRHLAFILEHHWESIVGKMVAWLPIILHFTVIHYGPMSSLFTDLDLVLTFWLRQVWISRSDSTSLRCYEMTSQHDHEEE